jgi:hypothetical protein
LPSVNAQAVDIERNTESGRSNADVMRGHAVWLHPPYAHIDKFVRRYKQCEAGSAQNTSACVVVRAWDSKHIGACCKECNWYGDMKHVWHIVFSAPHGMGGRKEMDAKPNHDQWRSSTTRQAKLLPPRNAATDIHGAAADAPIPGLSFCRQSARAAQQRRVA